MGNTTEDRLTKGSALSNLWKLSYPTMLSFILHSIYDIVDMIWVGHISYVAISGVTIFSTIFWVFEIFNQVIGNSSISMLSQSYGRKDEKRTKLIAEQTISFKVFVGIISAVALWLVLMPALRMYTSGSDPAERELIIKYATDYGYIRLISMPIMFLSFSLNTIFRCTGDSKTPMKIIIGSTILNIVLDPILMFETVPYIGIKGFAMGTKGAALATLISTIIAVAIELTMLLGGKKGLKISFKGLFKLNFGIDKSLITIGLPNGLEVFLRNMSMAVTMKFVFIYGTKAVTVMGIVGKVSMLSFLTIYGLMIGASTIIGQCLGSENVKQAEDTINITAKLNVIIMAVISIVVVVFPQEIIKIFVRDDVEVIALGVKSLRYIVPCFVVMGYGLGKATAFMGSGYNMPFLIACLVSRWLVQIGLMFIFVKILHKPYEYLLLTYILAEIAETIILLYYYKKADWRIKRV